MLKHTLDNVSPGFPHSNQAPFHNPHISAGYLHQGANRRSNRSLTDAYLPQVQCLTAATVGLRLLRRVGGCRASAVQHQEELGQSA